MPAFLPITTPATLPSAGTFVPRASSGSQTVIVAAGTLVTIIPPEGQRVRLNYLATVVVATVTNITVEVGGIKVIENKTLTAFSNSDSTNRFFISSGVSDSGAGASGITPPILGKVDETIKIIKGSGTIGTELRYNFQTGE